MTDTQKPKLERCGACGDYNADPRLYTEQELAEAENNLGYDGCRENEPYQPTIQEMADAGIISLDSNGYPL